MGKSHYFVLGLALVSAGQVMSICIPPNHCIEDMEAADVKERFDYVLAKYEELDMKVPGEPVGLHGKVVTHGEAEEQHLVFQYMDNTPHDIIQTCAFVVVSAPGECESIRTYCSGFLRRQPRPLLERKPIEVCEDRVQLATEPPEPETVPDADAEAGTEADPQQEQEEEAETTTGAQDAPNSKLVSMSHNSV
ncbi:uncharacterized protein Dana_GF17477 [Drosophila ananassae]|uniref:Cystatin domain-containing protein n=1 Tax=Drosophila ananassae TaxID=7217 RepID=B3LVW7_DROAN|nr:uncharacterized protein LOC6500261 [Drosophila ananassae]EDV41500.2 uncharacterized protein Dana_GF17477 [Drosophila ananassae]